MGRKTASELHEEIKKLKSEINRLDTEVRMLRGDLDKTLRTLTKIYVELKTVERIFSGGIWSEIKNILEEIAEALKEKKRRRWRIF